MKNSYLCGNIVKKMDIMRRKKIFWIIVALFAVITANAQFRFGIRAGVNIANATFDRDVYQLNNVTGFHLGPVVEGMFGQGGIGIDAAILYSQKGFKTDETVKNSFIDVPVNVKFKLGLPLVNPYIAAGPFISLRVGGEEKWVVSGVVDQMKTQSFGAGLNFAIGAEIFERLQIGLTYGWGLTDNYKTFEANTLDSYKGKLHTWQVSATFFF